MELEARLKNRYEELVRAHVLASQALSAGVSTRLKGNNSFAQTQAAWRFLNNERCKLNILMAPILKASLEGSEELCMNYALVAHDWSGLAYKRHASKEDRTRLHNEKELGYELQTSLLLSDRHGGPIAPVALNLVTKTGVLSTYRKDSCHEETHLEELAKRVNYIESCGFKKALVHIVDREGDSVQWMRALGGSKWLVRSRSNSCVYYNQESIRVDKLAEQLSFRAVREVSYQGRKGEQYLGEANIVINRLAQPKKKEGGKKVCLKGEAVVARLIVSRIEDGQGRLLALWYLITNVQDVKMEEIALWYYWRWSIESFFKLLKSSGMQIERWQQESGEAIARRLLVVCMACVFVWQIAEAKGPEAGELRTLLVRLSGRQMKYGVAFTRPALLAGLAALLNTLDVLERYDVEELKNLLRLSSKNIFV